MPNILEVVSDYSNPNAPQASFAATPAEGEVIIVCCTSQRAAAPRSVVSLTGCDATWTQLYQPAGSRVSWWKGVVGPSAPNGQVVPTYSGSLMAGHITAWRTDLPSAAAVSVDMTTGTATSLTGPTLSAGNGQIAFSCGVVMADTLTWPSAQTPAGWATRSGDLVGYVGAVGTADRVPASTADHRTDVATPSSVSLAVSTLVMGSVAGPAAPQVSFAGSLPALTGSFDLSRAAAPVEVAFAGALPLLVGSFSLDVPAPEGVTFAGDLPALTGSFLASAEGGVRATTDRVDRANGRTRVCEWTVEVEPPVAEPTRTRGHDYAVTGSLDGVTFIDGRPT